MNLVADTATLVGIALIAISWTLMALDARKPHGTRLRSTAITLLIPAAAAALIVVAIAPYAWGWRVLAAAGCITVVYRYVRSERQKQSTTPEYSGERNGQ